VTECNVLALLPSLTKGAQSIEIFRAMSEKGIDVAIAFSADSSAPYAADEMDDFLARDRLIDLSRADLAESFEVIGMTIEDLRIDLIVQVGAASLYPNLPRWKEANPKLRIADVLYESLYTLTHFLYERSIDGVIVESETMRRYIKRASFNERPTLELIRSGVDLDSFTPQDRPPRDGSPITVGYVGQLSPEKNQIAFVDLAERLLDLEPDLAFRMAGGGPGATELERRLADSPYRDRLVYAGFVGDVRSGLHGIDVLILPSKLSGRPVIVMEANACGIPVIAAPVGAVPEMIDDGVNGYLLCAEETSAIHDLLSMWKKSPDTLTQLQRSAREYACRMFDRDRMIDDYANAFRGIAATPEAENEETAMAGGFGAGATGLEPATSGVTGRDKGCTGHDRRRREAPADAER
jgi:glycosyltransferase involved in cell wall biosynthesis